MKNVTPAAGHVWNNRNHSDQVTVRSNIDGQIQYNSGICVFEMPCSQFIKSFEFIPQNDLEWLAVNVDKWFKSANQALDELSGTAFYWRGDSIVRCATIENDAVYHTRDQWLNMRYELGLDEKPKRKVYFGPSDRQHYDIARCYDDAVKLAEKQFMAHNKKETTMLDLSTTKFSTTKGVDAAKAFRELGKVIDNLNKQKETTMLDLSTAKIGDEFVLRNGEIVTFRIASEMNAVCQYGNGHFSVFELDGEIGEYCIEGGSDYGLDIVSKHDSRTDEEKAIDDLIKPALIFAASSGSYQKDAEKFLNVIKADEIHGVKWVVE